MKRAVVLALAALMVFGVAGAALADGPVTYEGAGNPLVATNGTAVTVKATVNPRLTLSITTPDGAQTVDFGDALPGTPESANVSLAVKSNKAWGMTKLVTGAAPIGLTTTIPADMTTGGSSVAYGAKGQWDATDVYTIDVPWDTDPSVTPYEATVVYTVTQSL